MTEREFTVGDVRVTTGCSHTMVHRAVEELGIDSKRTNGGHRRFTREQAQQLVRFIEEKKVKDPRALIFQAGTEAA